MCVVWCLCADRPISRHLLLIAGLSWLPVPIGASEGWYKPVMGNLSTSSGQPRPLQWLHRSSMYNYLAVLTAIHAMLAIGFTASQSAEPAGDLCLDTASCAESCSLDEWLPCSNCQLLRTLRPTTSLVQILAGAAG